MSHKSVFGSVLFGVLACLGLVVLGCNDDLPISEEIGESGQALSGPGIYSINCATEGGHCSFPATRPVAYCAFPNDEVVCHFGTATNGVDCNNTVFGDPSPGLTKTCFLGLDGFSTRGCSEGQHCPAVGGYPPVRWIYGDGLRWVEKVTTNGTYCTNDAFGRDPAPGITKNCYYRIETVPSYYTLCASEGGSCSFTGYYNTKVIAYGANGHFFYKTFQNNVACSNATFGDPAPGYTKACYQRN